MQQVLELLLSTVRKARRNSITDGAMYGLGHDYSPRLGEGLESRRNVHPVPIDAAVGLFDDIAEVKTDAEAHASVLGDRATHLLELPLGGQCRGRRPDSRVKHGKYRVAGRVDNAAPVSLDVLAEDGSSRVEGNYRAPLVRSHQARICDRIRGQDRRQPMFER